MVKLIEDINKDMEFNDRYFPRVDLSNPRYKKYKYKGYMFAYDTKDCLVLKLFKEPDEEKELGKDAPWRELDAAGLSSKNWRNREARNEYLDEWIFDTDAEGERLANDFIKYELPYYSESKSVNEKDWKLKLDSEISNNLRNAIGDGDYYGVLSNLKRAYTFINKECPDYFDSDDLESANEELDNIINAYESGDYDEDEYDCSEDYIEDEIDYALNDFWNLCDSIDMWVPLLEVKNSSRSDVTNESADSRYDEGNTQHMSLSSIIRKFKNGSLWDYYEYELFDDDCEKLLKFFKNKGYEVAYDKDDEEYIINLDDSSIRLSNAYLYTESRAKKIESYRVRIYLPFFDDDEDMKYTTTTVDATSEDEARRLGQKYINNKKTSKNSRIWKDAKVDHIKEI